jgi:phage terminase small subunit
MPILKNMRHEKFCQNIILGLNQTESYRKAGYICTEETARANASELLTNTNIIERLNELREKAEKKFDITRERILQEYSRLAFSNLKNFFNDDGTMKLLNEIDEDSIRAIAGLEVEQIFKGGNKSKEVTGLLKKIKIADKKGALDSLARIKGMFVDKIEHSGKITIDDLVNGDAIDD